MADWEAPKNVVREPNVVELTPWKSIHKYYYIADGQWIGPHGYTRIGYGDGTRPYHQA